MSGVDYAAIIGAVAWMILVFGLCYLLVSLFRLVNEISAMVKGVTDETVPLISGLSETIAGVNVELARVDTIIAGVQSITATADSLVGVVHATVSNPLVKTAAFVYGARGAARKLSE